MNKAIQISKLDKEGFEYIFKEYFTQLCFFAKKYISDTDTAKELVHDVFINLWEKRDTIDPEKSIKSYLFTSVNNRCLNYIRDNKKYDRDKTEIENLNNHSIENNNHIEETELQDRINSSIANLPEKCKKIFILSRFEEMKYHEIADKLDVSIKTVEAQMSKALKILRENLKEYLPILVLIYFFIKNL